MTVAASSLAKRSLIPLGVGVALLAGSFVTDALRFGPSPELGEEVTMFVVEPDVDTVVDVNGSSPQGPSTSEEIVVVVGSDAEPIIVDVDVDVSSSPRGLDIAVASDAGIATNQAAGSGSDPERGNGGRTSLSSDPGRGSVVPSTPTGSSTPRRTAVPDSESGRPDQSNGAPTSPEAPSPPGAPDGPVLPDVPTPLPPAVPMPDLPDLGGLFPVPDTDVPYTHVFDLPEGARIDEDGGVIVHDPDGDLSDVTAAAAAAAAGAAAGVDPTATAVTGTAIDDDGDVAAGAQIYVSAESDGDGAAAAGAVAAAADNNATIGEPEVEAEAELELADDVSGIIEIYADASVIVISEDVTGQEDGESLVIEAAIVIVRENQIVIVRANAATGRFDGSSVTMGNVVAVEREMSIDQDDRIADSSALPTSLTERILVALGSEGAGPSTSPATIAPSSLPEEYSSTDETLDDFVSEIIGAVNSAPTTEIDLSEESVADIDDAGEQIPTDDAIVDVAPIDYDPDAAETEAEAEAEAEADANETGGAAAGGAASSSASTADASGSAEADDGLGQTESEGSTGEAATPEPETTPIDGPSTEEPLETADATSASTEAEATDGEAVATSSDGPDDLDFDEELEAVAEPEVEATP